MTTTRAVQCNGFGDASVLEIAEVPVREPCFGEVAVEVVACGLNRADVLQRQGRYPAPAGFPSNILGLEYMGRIAALGEGVTAWREGDRVMGIVGGGAMVRRLIVHERELMPVPETLTDDAAAAVPEVFVTTFDALLLQAELGPGETLLVHSAGSGIGTAASQLAAVVGATGIGTSRTPGKLEKARPFGLSHGVVPNNGLFADEVMHLTNGRGVDVILDTVGAPYFSENIKALAPKGRMVLVGTLGGAKAEAPLGLWMAKRARIFGTVLRSRPLEEKISLACEFSRRIIPMFTDRRLRAVVDEVMPMERIADAHRKLESDASFGKIVLRW